MKINIVGLGNVGRTLVNAYKERENIEIHVFDKDKTKVLNTIDKKKVFPVKKVEDFTDAETTFITVIDDQILSVMDEISENYKGNIVIMSGIMSIEDAKKHIRNANNLIIMHPIQTFPDIYGGKERFKNIYITVEYTQSKKFCEDFCNEFECHYIEVPQGFNRKIYHASCIFASNFVVMMAYIADELLNESGFENEDMGYILLPLIKNTVNNIINNGIKESISGPIKRGDNKVIEKHLSQIEDKDIKNVYKILMRKTYEYFKKNEFVIMHSKEIEDLINE